MNPRGVLALLLFVAACSDPVQGPSVDRRAILRDLAANVIIPVYDSFAGAAADLETKTAALCAAPDEAKLTAAQTAWRAARVPWKRAEAFELGPVKELRLKNAIDFWPVRAADVEEVLTDTASITDAYVDGLGASAKGLPVLETLIFDAEGNHDRVLSALNGAPRRCAYATALARDVEEQAAALARAWKPGEGDFAAQLSTAGDGSSRFNTLAQAIDEVVNALISAAQVIEGDKLARPLGKRSGGVAQPGDVESPVSANSIAELLDNLRGLESVYLCSFEGRSGVSFGELVLASNSTLDMKIRAQLRLAGEAVSAIPPPLSRAVVESPASVEAAFDSNKALLRLLGVDMAGLLGVTTAFTDNDGD